MPRTRSTDLHTRRALCVSLVVAGLAHVPVTGHHAQEAAYMGVMFVTFTVMCLFLALVCSVRATRGALLATVGLQALALGTYALVRVLAFPGLEHDLGNWAEPWGLVSVVAESTALLTAGWLVRGRAVTPARALRTGAVTV